MSVLKKSVLDDGASRTVSEWEGRVCDPDLVSGYEAVLQIEGSSELSRLALSSFEHQIVSLLPDAYNGNVIFELPPVSHEELAKKGGMLAGMDRSNDCWLWTKCVTTSAQIGGKKTNYSVNRIRCVGLLKCVNDLCPFLLKEGRPNQIDWPDRVHCTTYLTSIVYPCRISTMSVVIVELLRCVKLPVMLRCTTLLRNIPSTLIQLIHMSRITIHVGRHCHPHRRVCSRRHVNSVKAVVKETLYSSPHFTPTQVQAVVSNQMILKMLDGLGAEGLTREENYDLLNSLSPMAVPKTFTNLIRSIRKSSKEPREESDIISLQQRINFRSRPDAPADVVIDSQTPIPSNQAQENFTGPTDSSSESDVQITHVRTRIRHSSRADDDDVLITGQTFRTRPPTRGTPTPIRTNAVDPPIVATMRDTTADKD
ncbi:hypothetical protein R1sor_007142 [Riccia sorocarpa]|uniref:Uncharacterized protein n=1 Tax=Riccia sorocarpa TaxID=122646 RepID=A0ABD3HTQ4_9MARC